MCSHTAGLLRAYPVCTSAPAAGLAGTDEDRWHSLLGLGSAGKKAIVNPFDDIDIRAPGSSKDIPVFHETFCETTLMPETRYHYPLPQVHLSI